MNADPLLIAIVGLAVVFAVSVASVAQAYGSKVAVFVGLIALAFGYSFGK